MAPLLVPGLPPSEGRATTPQTGMAGEGTPGMAAGRAARGNRLAHRVRLRLQV